MRTDVKIGDRVKFTKPLFDLSTSLEFVNETGKIGEHPHQHYPNLIVWIDSGGWADLADLSDDAFEVIE